jgi:hypothetical protein
VCESVHAGWGREAAHQQTLARIRPRGHHLRQPRAHEVHVGRQLERSLLPDRGVVGRPNLKVVQPTLRLPQLAHQTILLSLNPLSILVRPPPLLHT